MKKIITLLLALVVCTSVEAQQTNSYSEYMTEIKSNNPALKSLELTLKAQSRENRIGNTPSDISVSVEPTFGGDISTSVGIDFLFPTMYYQMKKLAVEKTKKNEFDYYVATYAQLQNIDLAYLQAIYANKKVDVLNELVENNKTISTFFEVSLDNGSATILEVNKTKGELITSISVVYEAQAEKQNNNELIKALNGGIEYDVNSMSYPMFNIGAIDTYVERALEKSYEMLSIAADSIIAVRNVKVNKHSWAPNIGIAYKNNVTPNNSALTTNGVEAVVSIPIWQNMHKVRAAKLQYSATVENNRKTRLDIIAKLESLKNSLYMTIKNYEMHNKYFESTSTVELLKKSLQEKELSVIDYYTEINFITGIRLQQLDYEYQMMVLTAQMQNLLY